MLKKIKIKLKIEKILKYWSYLSFLRSKGIFIFCNNLCLNASKDLLIQNYFADNKYKWKILNLKICKGFIDNKFYKNIKNFNSVLIVKDVNNILEVEKYLKNFNIQVLGYFVENFFFVKKDFTFKYINKTAILEHLIKKIKIFSILKKKIYLILNFVKKKILLVLNKR